MGQGITDAFVGDLDVDLVQTFLHLPSDAMRVEVIQCLVDCSERQQLPLLRHRFLLRLARLNEELARISPAAAKVVLVSLAPQLRTIAAGMTDQDFSTAQNVSASLRHAASRQLQMAILALCPRPDDRSAQAGPTRSSIHTRAVETLAPVRLDLGMGGIADVPPFSLERLGNCLNVPVSIDGALPLYARARILADRVLVLASTDMGATRTYHSFSDLRGDAPTLRLHEECLRFWANHVLGLATTDDLFALVDGGIHLETHSRLPMGTGLGSSTLLLCAMMRTLGTLCDISLSPNELFTASVYLENAAGIGGGWEDATALYSGFKLMTSCPNQPFSPTIHPLEIDSISMCRLHDHVVLFNTGLPKSGQGFFEAMIERYTLRDAAALDAIDRNYALNQQLPSIIAAADLPSLGEAMNSQWLHWKVLSEGECSNPLIDCLFEEIAPYVYGGRMNGSGQGGCAMFVIRDGQHDALLRIAQAVLGRPATFYQWDPVL